MTQEQRVGEVIVASTAEFTAQCYELYNLPPLGCMVKATDGSVMLYGVVYNATTTSLEPGRRPIARGKDETSEEEVYRASPQLTKLLCSEFSALMVGHKEEGKLRYYLPPKPARIHGFVYLCDPAEVKEFSQSLDFLDTLLNARLTVSPEELTSASLRQMSLTYEDPRAFLLTAGKKLATLLACDFNRLKTVLGRLSQ